MHTYNPADDLQPDHEPDYDGEHFHEPEPEEEIDYEAYHA